jgi:hypothetical protein
MTAGVTKLLLLIVLLVALLIGITVMNGRKEGFEQGSLDVNCVEGCKSYMKCYAAYNGDKSGIVDMCSSYPGMTDETACNRCKFCQWCPGGDNKSNAKCISIYEKCPVGKPDIKSDWIDTEDDQSSELSIFDFTKYFSSYVQPTMDACGANIPIWDNLQAGIKNLNYVNSSSDDPDRPDGSDRPDRRPSPYKPNRDDEECEDDDSWPQYASDQHRIADEQQERMSLMRVMKQAVRSELMSQLNNDVLDEEECEEEEDDCKRDSECTAQGKEIQQQRIDMSKYIRKDSIPCWGCDVE